MISESDSSRHLEQTNCAAGVSAAAMKYDFIIVVVMVSRVVLQTIHRIHNITIGYHNHGEGPFYSQLHRLNVCSTSKYVRSSSVLCQALCWALKKMMATLLTLIMMAR